MTKQVIKKAYSLELEYVYLSKRVRLQGASTMFFDTYLSLSIQETLGRNILLI